MVKTANIKSTRSSSRTRTRSRTRSSSSIKSLTSSGKTRSLSVRRSSTASTKESTGLSDNHISQEEETERTNNFKQSQSSSTQVEESSQKDHQSTSTPKSISVRSTSLTRSGRSSNRRSSQSLRTKASSRTGSRSRSRSRTRSRSRVKSSSRSRSRSKSKENRSLRNILPPELKLHKRNLVTAFVVKNKETNFWMTTIESQSDSQKQIYSFQSEDDAKECAYANSPPKLVPFKESPTCFLCDEPFHSLRRRAMHCKNCGACICKSCSSSWNKEMVPEFFNIKNSSKVVVCKTCDFLSTAFRGALLDGQYKQALKIYMTGNINLRCPFANVNSGMEVMYPIHCTAVSGNMELVRWLIDTHRCPYQEHTPRNRTIVVGMNPNDRSNCQKTISQSSQLLKTSNGRTILDIALQNNDIDLLQYLVKEKKIALSSQNSSQDQDTVWKALGLILSANSEDGNSSDSNKNSAIDSKFSSTTSRSNCESMKDSLKINLDNCRINGMGSENSNVRANREFTKKSSKGRVLKKDSDDKKDSDPFREVGNSCHESTFNMSLVMNDKIDKFGSELFDFISEFDDYDDDEEEEEEDNDSSGSDSPYRNNATGRNKKSIWKNRGKNEREGKRGQRNQGLRFIDLKESQRLSRLKLEHYRLKTEGTAETENNENDTNPLMCNFTCPIFIDDDAGSFWSA